VTVPADALAPAAVRLRAATGADVEALSALEELVFGDEVHRISRRQWRYLVSRPGSRTVVAESAGQLLGALVLTCRAGGRVLRIYSLAVHPAARRRGIARLFLDEAEAFGHRERLQTMHLEVARTNRPAITLYRSAGFEIAATLRDYYGLGEDGLRMEKPLAGG
jgi:ribosomal protein S18 acetylase RimI-like enzyme